MSEHLKKHVCASSGQTMYIDEGQERSKRIKQQVCGSSAQTMYFEEEIEKCACDRAKKPYKYNYDTRGIAIANALEADKSTSTNAQELLLRIWQSAKPPENLSAKLPVVSARQLHLIRSQIYGRDNRRLFS